MTTKELIPKLIEHYEKCINEMPEEGWVTYTFNNNIDMGICHCAKKIFNENIYNSTFVIKYVGSHSSYLCRTTSSTNSFDEAKKSLRIRLNRLKEFL